MDSPNLPTPSLSQDAAIVLVLAETAVQRAASPEDEAERWVRILRLHGEVGCALQALGVPEGPLETPVHEPARRAWRLRARREDIVETVCRRTMVAAGARGARLAGTVDVLTALFEIYDRILDRALYARGTTRAELLELLEERTRLRRSSSMCTELPQGVNSTALASTGQGTAPRTQAT